MKNQFLLLSLIACGHLCAGQEQPLKKRQARNYVEHVLESLIDPTKHDGNHLDDIESFIEQTADMLSSQRSSSARLYSAALSQTIGYIEEKSRHFAKKMIRSIDADVDEQSIVHHAVQAIKSQVNQILNTAKTLPQGALTDFVGAPLKAKVAALINQETAHRQSAYTHKKNKKHYHAPERTMVHQPVVYQEVVCEPYGFFAPCVYEPAYDYVIEQQVPHVGFGFQVARPHSSFAFNFGF